jgi:carboxypeptidase D
MRDELATGFGRSDSLPRGTFTSFPLLDPHLTSPLPYHAQRSDVVNALHAQAKQEAWQECSGRVGSILQNRDSPSSIALLPKVVEKIRVLLFAGDQDVICNYVGQERLIERLEWKGDKGMQGAETKTWVVNGTDAGTWQEARGLSFVKVR